MPDTVAAIVPMKGHSERVPGKNYRPLDGVPLFAYVLDALSECDLVDRVYVDTDDATLAASVTERFPKITIIDRPVELHGDLVPMNDVLVHDASIIDAEWMLQTHTTNPLLTTATIRHAIELVLGDDGTHDSLMSVTRLQTRLWWGPGEPVNHDPAVLLRTQDLPPVFEENSNLYVFRRQHLLDTGSRLGKAPIFLPTDQIESWDIDEETDFSIAEALVRWRKAQ
jgi:CMP-N-acetylneuraminic acid synthetase